MISGNTQFLNSNDTPKSVISSNVSFFKEKFEDLRHFFQEKDRVLNSRGAVASRKRLRSTFEKEDNYLNPTKTCNISRKITVAKTIPKNTKMQHLSFQTIDEALYSLKGDVRISEFLLVISPGKLNSTEGSNHFEIHGIDKICRQYLGTIYVTRESLKQFEENSSFENYSMIVSNASIDPKTGLELVLRQFDLLNESECSSEPSFVSLETNTSKPFKIDKKSEPTLQDLLKRLDQNSESQSDLKKFFDFAEKYKFSTIVRPDFVNFSNQLVLDFFTQQDNYIGTFTLSNHEIENQLKQHKKLLRNLNIVEDTNEIVASKSVARFLKKIASIFNLLYIYDYISELIYKIHQNM